jgi:hypothetical protein
MLLLSNIGITASFYSYHLPFRLLYEIITKIEEDIDVSHRKEHTKILENQWPKISVFFRRGRKKNIQIKCQKRDSSIPLVSNHFEQIIEEQQDKIEANGKINF